MMYPDIYYLPQWAKLNAERDNGIAEQYYFESENGKILYPYIKRKIETKVDNEVYYDTITPYGFNGPVILYSINREELLDEFDNNFTEYCKKNHLIAEYVRFSPWLGNHRDFKKYYSLKYNNQTLCINLQKNFFKEEFSVKCRNVVKKAVKNEVHVELHFTGSHIGVFCELYSQMADKNQISSYYDFDEAFIAKTFDFMHGHIFMATAIYNDIPISSALFLYNDSYIHYHLSGNDYNYTSLGANSLVLFEVAKWGQEQGINEFHLGGAAPESSLLRFKKAFTKNGLIDYFVGTRIRNEIVYNKLVDMCGRNNGYFPEYRG